MLPPFLSYLPLIATQHRGANTLQQEQIYLNCVKLSLGKRETSAAILGVTDQDSGASGANASVSPLLYVLGDECVTMLNEYLKQLKSSIAIACRRSRKPCPKKTH
jgi:hypothetical protein